MIVGITATRTAPGDWRVVSLARKLAELGATELHHGDCVGGDAAAHYVAVALEIPNIIVHPPTDPKLRAFCTKGAIILSPLPYIQRNHAIVDTPINWLIAMPKGYDEELSGSGTWATVRYAESKHVPIWVIWPNGFGAQWERL